MKTQVTLVLLALGLACGSAYAAAAAEMPMPVSNDINVTAPDQSGTWIFGATAVLMQPTNKAFNYADSIDATITDDGSILTGNDTHHSVDEGYSWWFGADVSYAFPGNGRDVTLAYEGLHATASDNTAVPPAGANGFTELVSDFTGIYYQTARGETNTRYDAGDLLFGQKIDVGTRIGLHPFLGVRYAHIDTTDSGSYYNAASTLFSSDDTTRTAAENASLENQFNGVGPRLGSDAEINLGSGFSVRARLGLSVLIGSHSIDNDAVVVLGADIDNPEMTIYGTNNSDSQTRVIPEIDGRLGLNYTYSININTTLGLEVGWQATNYFNVISDQYPVHFGIAGIADTDIGGAVGNQQYDSTSNFGLQGPYARLQLAIS